MLPTRVRRGLAYQLGPARGLATLTVYGPSFLGFQAVLDFIGDVSGAALKAADRNFDLTANMLDHIRVSRRARDVLLGRVPGVTVRIIDD